MNRLLLTGLALACLGTLADAAPTPPAKSKNPVVEFKTSLGSFKVELYPEKAPITVKNFLGYVDDKFYDGTLFHRVIPTFMIQGGGFQPGLKQKETKAPIKNESGNGLSNERGTIAMARTSDPDTATAQFFINVKDNAFLDGREGKAGYAVFGKVISGMDVVDKIKKVETGTRGSFKDVPVRDVVIKSARRIK
jgi:cyclophilin family peptidyl-prolyl cis-trans isomerase